MTADLAAALEKAEQAVREGEDRLRRLLDYQAAVMNNLAEGLYVLDTRGLVTSVNPAAETMLGWRKEELLGKRMHDAAHYKRADGTLFPASECSVQRALREATELREYPDIFVRKDGSFLPVIVNCSPVRTGKKILGLVVGIRDVAQQRRAEEALQESEKRFRTVADAAPMLIWMSGPDALCNFFNQPWLDFTGRTLEQEWGNGWVEGVHPDDFEPCVRAYLSAFEKQQPFTMEYRLRRADGEYRWVLDNAVPRYAGSGEFAGYIGSCVDVTDRKRQEEAQFRLAALVESSNDAIIFKDLNGVITSWNGGAQRLFGFTSQEAVGQSINIIIPRELPEEEGKILSRLRGGHRIEQYETIRLNKSGSKLHVSLTISPVRDSKGGLIGAFKIARDIADRRHAEKKAELV